ncbi:MAG: ACP S-malonyltransferase [Candidatus Dasytiphilus stammeri]
MTNFAMMFPGQGSQSIGMLAEIARYYPIIKQTFYEASESIGYDLWNLVQNGTTRELNQTSKTQPILLTSSVAIFRLWQNKGGPIPSILLGHSLGEYSALVCAGAIPFKEAVGLVELRAKVMQEAVPEGTGAMLAVIGLSHETLINICEFSARGEFVAPVNFNSPEQFVIAGHKGAVFRAGQASKQAGARVLSLPITIPSHCALMKPVAEKFARALEKFTITVPVLPVINNADVQCESLPSKIRSALVRQLYNPVRWIESVEYLISKGIDTAFEIGPSNVLCGLTKRINQTLMVSSINNSDSLSAALKQLITKRGRP